MASRKTDEQFKQDVLERIGIDYEVLSEYKGTYNKVKVRHNKCEYVWDLLPNNLLRGASKCPNCSRKRKLSDEEFQEKLDSETNSQFLLIGTYGGVSRKNFTTLKHKVCCHEFTVSGSHLTFEKPIGCRKCSNMLIHDKERVELLLEEKYGSEYVLLSDEVKNNRDKIIVKHNACDNEFETTSTKIINVGTGCPHCSSHKSKGEIKIEKILKQFNIKHIREYTFNDCRYKSVLFFDFAIFDSANKLLGLIEFDGKQHFEPVEFFGGIEGFKVTKIRDEIKNNYCKDKNIPLIRIPYFKEDCLDEIINNIFINDKLKDGDLILC